MKWTQSQVDSLTLPYNGRDCRGRIIIVEPGREWSTVVLRIEGRHDAVISHGTLCDYLNAWRVEDKQEDE
jgi:hypothetical protein